MKRPQCLRGVRGTATSRERGLGARPPDAGRATMRAPWPRSGRVGFGAQPRLSRNDEHRL